MVRPKKINKSNEKKIAFINESHTGNALHSRAQQPLNPILTEEKESSILYPSSNQQKAIETLEEQYKVLNDKYQEILIENDQLRKQCSELKEIDFEFNYITYIDIIKVLKMNNFDILDLKDFTITIENIPVIKVETKGGRIFKEKLTDIREYKL